MNNIAAIMLMLPILPASWVFASFLLRGRKKTTTKISVQLQILPFLFFALLFIGMTKGIYDGLLTGEMFSLIGKSRKSVSLSLESNKYWFNFLFNCFWDVFLGVVLLVIARFHAGSLRFWR
ncbi:MAG: hypothetical protein R3E63_02665 [Pseudomonadales bacterium]